MLTVDDSVLVCPWCGETSQRDSSQDPEASFETSRSPLMAVLRMRQVVTAECPKCKASVLINHSMEQMWNVPPGKADGDSTH